MGITAALRTGTKCRPLPFPSLLPFSFLPVLYLLPSRQPPLHPHPKCVVYMSNNVASVICRTKGPQTDSSQTIAPELPGGSPGRGGVSLLLSQGKEPPRWDRGGHEGPLAYCECWKVRPGSGGSLALWFCPTSDGGQASRLQLS